MKPWITLLLLLALSGCYNRSYLNEGDVVTVYKWGTSTQTDAERLRWTYPKGQPAIGERVTIRDISGTSVYLVEYPIYHNGLEAAWSVNIFMKWDDWAARKQEEGTWE